ncbi:MAG: hypothetical protein AAGC80_17880 [Rhodococcus sp. (in: high G+C Gram-positive bacteria)]
MSRRSGDFWVAKYGEIAVVRAGSAVGVAGMTVVVFTGSPAVAVAGFLVVGLVVPVVAPVLQRRRTTGGPGQADDVVAPTTLFDDAGSLAGGNHDERSECAPDHD